MKRTLILAAVALLITSAGQFVPAPLGGLAQHALASVQLH